MAACSLCAGLAAYWFSPSAVFVIVAGTGAVAIACLPLINGIDHAVARGLAPKAVEEPAAAFADRAGVQRREPLSKEPTISSTSPRAQQGTAQQGTADQAVGYW